MHHFRSATRNWIGEMVIGVYEASSKGCKDACFIKAEEQGKGIVKGSREEPFSKSSPLRETGWRPCWRILPPNQYSAPDRLSSL